MPINKCFLRLDQIGCVKGSGIESFLTPCVFACVKIGLPYCINACELCRSERAFNITFRFHTYATKWPIFGSNYLSLWKYKNAIKWWTKSNDLKSIRILTFSGSPLKSAIFSWIHFRARFWSHSPRFPGMTSSLVDKNPKTPRR